MEHDSLLSMLRDRFARAVAQVAGVPLAEADAMVRPAQDPRFGDYQCNAAMPLARPLKAKPREIAERIKAAVEPSLAGLAESLEIAGPGFINVRLRDECLACYLQEIPAPSETGVDRFGLAPVEQPLRVVVEYSQPNIAKQMHVGHLRSTIIGDVFARVLAFEGHEVVRQNHIGDWGTQFGMLIRWYRDHPLPTPQTHPDVLEAIENDYKAANERFGADEQFASEARLAVAELQSGDAEARQVWEAICAQSHAAFTEAYERLNVLLAPEDVCGESFYNERLPGIIRELREKLGVEDTAQEQWHTEGARAVVRDHEGAVVVYLYDEKGQPQFKNPDGEILGMIVQKSDGAFLYATTDLAAISYRLKELKFSSGVGAQRVIYVTDARQKLHFEMFFATARAMSWIADQHVEHVTFGSVLGTDRRPLKTRTGGTVKLRELLDEAEKRAYELLVRREVQQEEAESDSQTGGGAVPNQDVATASSAIQPHGSSTLRVHSLAKELGVTSMAIIERCRAEGIELKNHMTAIAADLAATIRTWFPDDANAASAAQRRQIARRVGIAAVKYADLRQDRTSDYVFDWDKMLALQGNTAPYMMYAYARIRSIYGKAAERFGLPDVYADGVALRLTEPTERALALRLARLRETIDAVAAELAPHVLCTYLYELAGDFMRFYEACPVLQAPEEAVRLSRMRLCDLTARALHLGLGLLGIETIERM